jgi:hypothetical protein
VGEEFIRVRCSSCAALVRVPRVSGSHECTECGATLSVKLKEQLAAPLKTEPTADERAAHTAERAQVSRQVTRLNSRLKFLRWIYALGALSSLGSLLMELTELTDPTQSVGFGLFAVGLATLTLVIWFCATLPVLQQPVLWF